MPKFLKISTSNFMYLRGLSSTLSYINIENNIIGMKKNRILLLYIRYNLIQDFLNHIITCLYILLQLKNVN